MISLALLIAALVFFILAALRVALPRVDPLALGLACFVLSFLLEGRL